jgi:hypothetical protein
LKKKPDEEKSLEDLVIENNVQARITYELAHQLEPHLPIASFKKLKEDLREVVVDKHRLPLKMFAPHISEDLFPIASIEDLVRTLSGGVRTALALAQDPAFPINNPSAREILATIRHEPGSRASIPIVFGAGLSSSIQLRKGGV